MPTMEDDPKVPIAEVYSKSLNLFKDKSRWVQGYYQYAKNGGKCGWAEGYSFCALGAMVFFSDGFSHRATCCLQRVSEHLYGECMQEVNDNDPDAYNKVMFALQFAKELWAGREPTDEELSMPVVKLLEKRNEKN